MTNKLAYLMAVGGRVMWSSESAETLTARLNSADPEDYEEVSYFARHAKPGEFILVDGCAVVRLRDEQAY
mgnify:CR=1 FL=1